MEKQKIIIYVDYSSQPSRAVAAFCKLIKIPHEVKEIRVAKGEHRKEDYQKINPNAVVPALTEVDLESNLQWHLFESHAILRYLAQSR